MEFTVMWIVIWIVLYIIVATVTAQTSESSMLCTSHQKTCEVRRQTIVCNNMIPKRLPQGSSSLIINCLLDNTIVENRAFEETSYRTLTRLELHSPYGTRTTFRSSCFETLNDLIELHISVAQSSAETGWLSGLNKLSVLNLTGCIDMWSQQIYSELYRQHSFPNLGTLVLKRFGVQYDNLALDEIFWTFISIRPINVLVFDLTQISVLDIMSMKVNKIRLKKISFRMCNILQIKDSRSNTEVVNIETIDMTGVILPAKGRPFCFWPVKNVHNIVKSIDNLSFFRKTKHLIFDEICNMGNPVTFEKVSNMFIMSNFSFNLETVSLKRNYIKVLDAQINCSEKCISLTSLCLSDNKMEFMNPDFLLCFGKTLQTLDLSNNNLNVMNKCNKTLFENIFKNLLKIETINLSSNALESIPKHMFAKSIKLRDLDLSRNRLRTISFNLLTSIEFEMLRISANYFKTLDTSAMRTIEDSLYSNDNASFDLSANDFQCKLCENLHTIQWLVKFSRKSYKQTTCTDTNGNIQNTDENIVSELRFVCKAPLRLGLSIGFSVGTLIFVCCISFIIVAMKRRKKRKERTEETIGLLKGGKQDCEFVVFLSFSSFDEKFLTEYVISPLEQSLQDILETSRVVVCYGDHEFRLGHDIADEIVLSLQRSAIVIILLSNAYAQSGYCCQEFEQALRMGKPVICMIKDTVNEDLLAPAMYELYKTNVRIIWTLEEGKYILKTTWKNVCDSILDIFWSRRTEPNNI